MRTRLLVIILACSGVSVCRAELPGSGLTATVTEIQPAVPVARMRGERGLIGDAIDADLISRVGDALWNIVKENQPSAEMDYDSAAAIPREVDHWEQLSGWNPHPLVRTFSVKVRNGLGREVVQYTYSIVAIYGGSFRNRGLYLQDVRMIANSIHVGWGYHLDAQVEVPSVYNIGTAENPEAAMVLVHRFSVQSLASHSEVMQHFVVRGSGKVEQTDPAPEL